MFFVERPEEELVDLAPEDDALIAELLAVVGFTITVVVRSMMYVIPAATVVVDKSGAEVISSALLDELVVGLAEDEIVVCVVEDVVD